MDTLHLEVNDAGGWRRVMSFAGDASTRRAVMQNAYYMLNCSDNPKLRARIIAPGDTAPYTHAMAAMALQYAREKFAEEMDE